jgi:murein DD-endopeptidase MepM/ murein hydrolase activator NlpD
MRIKIAAELLKKANTKNFIFLGLVFFLYAFVFVLQSLNISWKIYKPQVLGRQCLPPTSFLLEQISVCRSIAEQTFKASSRKHLKNQLLNMGLEKECVQNVISTLFSRISKLDTRQKITLTCHINQGKKRFYSLYVPISPEKHVLVTQRQCSSDWAYVARTITQPRLYSFHKIQGVLKTHLLSDLQAAGLSSRKSQSILKSMESGSISWRKILKPGDKFAFLFREVKLQSEKTGSFDALYMVRIERSGRQVFSAYRYQPPGISSAAFYMADGSSCIQTSLLKPVNRARLSSRFGMRNHPIYKSRKFHSGVDWAAPKGTPIFAAAQGKIVKVGWFGGYGKYVKIRHNNTYSTAYAHLSRYSSSTKIGTQVQKGQIIGYVGDTGTAQGAHLHFEVLKNSKAVNPLLMTSLEPQKLEGFLLKGLKKQVSYLTHLYTRSSPESYALSENQSWMNSMKNVKTQQ